jgi:hypothetical protein
MPDRGDTAQRVDLYKWVIAWVAYTLGLGLEPSFAGRGIPESLFSEAFGEAFDDAGRPNSIWFGYLMLGVNDPLEFQGLSAPAGATNEMFNFTLCEAADASSCTTQLHNGPAWHGQLLSPSGTIARHVVITPTTPYVQLMVHAT